MGIDLIGPLPTTSRGNKYIVTLIDYFSKWPEAAPLPDKTATGVAHFNLSASKFIAFRLCKYLTVYDHGRFGCTNVVIFKQGREFVNKVNDELMELTGSDHRVTSAYHPQTNGLVERLNQTTQNVLLKLVNENQDNWDELLPSALFAICTSQQKSAKYTPFELIFNR